MAEYIDKNKAINAVFEAFADGRSAYIALEAIPAADVQPVRHGRNICDTVPRHCEFKCSLCGAELSTVYGGENDFGMDGGYFKYCPNCGCAIENP